MSRFCIKIGLLLSTLTATASPTSFQYKVLRWRRGWVSWLYCNQFNPIKFSFRPYWRGGHLLKNDFISNHLFNICLLEIYHCVPWLHYLLTTINLKSCLRRQISWFFIFHKHSLALYRLETFFCHPDPNPRTIFDCDHISGTCAPMPLFLKMLTFSRAIYSHWSSPSI